MIAKAKAWFPVNSYLDLPNVDLDLWDEYMKYFQIMLRFVFGSIVLLLLVWMAGLPSAKASVDLIYFRTIAGQQVITLEWATASEIDFLGFLIYRGLTSNLAEAETIGTFIPAEGLPPAGGAEYDYIDTDVIDEVVYYYWLASVDQGVSNPSQYEYEGPRTATTAGGTTINTPIPTNPGSSTATPTHTPTPTAIATNAPGVTPTIASTTAAVTASPTVDLTPSVEPTPSRIPSGTFPQPPTPTRFAFSPTTAAATTTDGTNNSGDSESNGTGSENPQPITPVEGGAGQLATPGTLGESPTATPAFAANLDPLDSNNGAEVLGEAIASQNQSTDLLPPPGQTGTTTSNPQTNVSPLIIMGLLAAGIFTLGGVITTVVLLIRKP